MTTTRLDRIDSLVRELSLEDDPERLIRVFSQQADLLWKRDGLLTLTRRDLASPWYRISRSWRWREAINPWTEVHRLPLFDQGVLGKLLYEGKPAILNRFQVAPDDPAREDLEGMHSLAC